MSVHHQHHPSSKTRRQKHSRPHKQSKKGPKSSRAQKPLTKQTQKKMGKNSLSSRFVFCRRRWSRSAAAHLFECVLSPRLSNPPFFLTLLLLGETSHRTIELSHQGVPTQDKRRRVEGSAMTLSCRRRDTVDWHAAAAVSHSRRGVVGWPLQPREGPPVCRSAIRVVSLVAVKGSCIEQSTRGTTCVGYVAACGSHADRTGG